MGARTQATAELVSILVALSIVIILIVVGVKAWRAVHRPVGAPCAYGFQCASGFCQNSSGLGGAYGYMPASVPVAYNILGETGSFNLDLGGGKFGTCSASQPTPVPLQIDMPSLPFSL